MLYGNLIFIKKTGGDGSKFPVTEKDIKIGRSEGCLIRIYNQQVEPEHCQLIIEDNGQATLRNLSSHTVLNGKPLTQGDVTLCHGDILEIGARSARWEYLPSSTNYRQLPSPAAASGRLVAVVMPQQRSLGEQSASGTSASQASILKSSPLGKRSYSERGSDSSSAVKIRKSSGSDLSNKDRGDMLKLLTARHSFKSSKMVLHRAKVKDRKSISGMASTKTMGKVKSRKSTLPSWKVNLVSPLQRKSLESTNSLTRSVRKSTRSPKSALKTPSKKIMESKPAKLLFSASKNEIITSQTTPVKSKSSDEVVKSTSKSALKTVVKSPLKMNETFVGLTQDFGISPSPKKGTVKSPSKAAFSTPRQKRPKLPFPVHSESKAHFKRKKKMTLVLDRVDSPSSSDKKSRVNEKKRTNATSSGDNASDVIAQTSLGTNLINEVPPVKQKSQKSAEVTAVKKTPGRAMKSGRKSSANTSRRSLTEILKKTPRKSVIIKTPRSLDYSRSKSGRKDSEINDAQIEEKGSLPANISADTPIEKTPGKLVKGAGKSPSSVSQKTAVNQAISSSVDLKSDQTAFSQKNRKSSTSKTPLRKSGRASVSPRGVRRKLSPTSNAERAAKKLKTTSPKKPDKNKKAALLVLGIASRKQLLSQNVKVLLKRKIVKKAIKQSTSASAHKGSSKKTAVEATRKRIWKRNTESTKNKKAVKSSPTRLPTSPVKKPAKETSTKIPRGKKVQEANHLISSIQETSPNLSSFLEKSPLKQKKQQETGLSILSKSCTNEEPLPPYSFEKSPENYLFTSNRRWSKRLSSKNEGDRPDFVELCPTALGLIPKNVEIFKTPKVSKRRSLSLTTPKNLQSPRIVKSASTSKVANRKSVRFSSKNASLYSETKTDSPNAGEITHYDLTPVQTPDITLDVFVSPLTDKSSVTKKDLSASTLKMKETGKISIKSRRSNSEPTTCVRKLLQSPQPEINSENVSTTEKALLRSSRITASESPSPGKVIAQSKRISRGKLNDFDGVSQMLTIPRTQKSPKNNLSDPKGVGRLLRAPKDLKSPKNDLTDVSGVNKFFRTPKIQNSPKNDLTDVRGVKRLMKTPKTQKSPKNDLSDLRGVKKLLTTPKMQKSPKNDLSDLKGVKKLLTTPKMQKSPKNDLSDLKGVKKLLTTPKMQKSPKNDLSDLRGVKKLMQSPKVQKSPKNDLSNVAGVKQLLRTPRLQKNPKNELSDLRGVKNLLGSPKVQNNPKNDLSDVAGVKKLFTTPRVQKSPRNNLLDVSGVGSLFDSPVIQKLSRNSEEGTELPKSLNSEETFNKDLTKVTEVKQLLISKSPEGDSKNKKAVSRKLHVNDFRAIRGRRTIYSTPKGPKNDLSNLTGVRELFGRHKPICNFDVDLTGVSELFELPKTKATTVEKVPESIDENISEVARRVSKTVRSRRELEDESEKEAKTKTRRGRLLKVAAEGPNSAKKSARSKKSEDANSKGNKPSKRKAVEDVKTTRAKRSTAKKAQEVTVEEVKPKSRTRAKAETTENNAEGMKNLSTRKRKAQNEDFVTSPPKLRRKLIAVENPPNSVAKLGSSSRVRLEARSEKTVTARSVKKASAKTKTSSKVQSKTGIKNVQKVQSRSQKSSKRISDSEKKISPRKTRSVKAKSSSETKASRSDAVGKKAVKSATVQRKKASPTVKRSTRRK